MRFETLVWNRTEQVSVDHGREHGTTPLARLEELAPVDVLVTALPTTTEVGKIAERLEGVLKEGCTWIDCTSGNPAELGRIAERLRSRGIALVDAPVSGGPDGAANGELTVMAGGERSAFEAALPVLRTFGAAIHHLGPVGAGARVKALNNALCAMALWSTCEALVALERCGIAPGTALEVINGSSGRSHASETHVPRILDGDAASAQYGVTLALLEKDVRNAVSVLDEAGSFGPMLRLLSDLYRATSNTSERSHGIARVLDTVREGNVEWATSPER
jgi:3-hydroxyisobutyrate dehydrogenase